MSEGTKYDQGKASLMRGLIEYFPRACTEVAKCSDFGASKYSWGNWKNVEGGIDRYGNALMRHIVEEAKGELDDPESGLMHATHAAWNALAVLEQKLIAKEKDSGDN